MSLYRVAQNNEAVSGGGGGGRQITKWKTPSRNFEELIESITYYFFHGLKSDEVSKSGGGGGGALPKRNFLKFFYHFSEFTIACTLQQHNDGIILFVMSNSCKDRA